MPDDELVEGLCSGNPDAQNAFIEKFGSDSFVQNLLQRFSNFDSAEIEDSLAEILYSIIQNPQRVNLKKGSLKGFLYVSVRNRLIDLNRTKSKNLELVSLSGDIARVLPAPADTRYQEYIYNETEYSIIPQDVLSDVHKLSQTLKLTTQEDDHLRLRLEQHFDSQQTAELIGITPNNEKVRWNRLMKKVRKNLENYPSIVEYAYQNNIKIN